MGFRLNRWSRAGAGLALGVASSLVALANTSLPPASPGLAEVQELAQGGRASEALRRLDTLIAKSPQDPQLRFQRGVLLVDLKRTPEAIALFERMARDFPTLPEPMNNLAVLYAEQGQIDKARAALELAVRSRPSYDTAYQNLSSVNVRMASRAYAKALQIDDSSAAPRLAMLKSLNGSHQDSPPVMIAAATPAPTPTSPPPPGATTPMPNLTGAGAAGMPSAPAAPPPSAAKPMPTPSPAEPPVASPADPLPRGKPTDANVTTANPATANAAQKRATEEAREVNEAVLAWASAWERKDMNAYLGAYVSGFKGTDASASEWQSNRRQRITGKNRISVELSGVTVELQGSNAATVSFRQAYAADQLRASSRKVLDVVKRDGKWLIRKESVN